MLICIARIVILFTISITSHHLATGERRCRCLANDASCWPSTDAWQSFNDSVDGRLLLPVPSASVCNGDTYNATACNIAKTEWHNSIWRSDLIGALQNHNWENSSCSVSENTTACVQGSVPVYGVDALVLKHVTDTVRFAARNNLRLVIKNTGHDYLGRSTAAGSLLLWLHHMKSMELLENYTTCNGEKLTHAAKIGAGVQWGAAYLWLHGYKLVAIGGASGSVGVVGGYMQGGGHSPLSRWKGMAADQVVEYEVVTADGRHLTVNSCEEKDLFWALNGGGGGTFAIVLSVIIRVFPTPSVAVATYDVTAPSDARYKRLMEDMTRMLSDVVKIGWSGYFTMMDTRIRGVFHVPNGNIAVVNDTLNEFAANNLDLDFTKTSIFNLPSFFDYFSNVLEPSNPTGFNVLLSSRLIRESIVHNSPARVADVLIQARGQERNGSFLLGHIVAGGEVSNMYSRNNSINPGWRTALLHMVYSQAWGDTTPTEIQEYLAMEVTRRTTILDQLLDGSQPSCYTNEADPNEVNWPVNFFGSQAIYNQLKTVKDRYDPDGLFICKNCVGSDDWTEDLNCPKAPSSPATTGSSTSTSFTTTSKYSAAPGSFAHSTIFFFTLIQGVLFIL